MPACHSSSKPGLVFARLGLSWFLLESLKRTRLLQGESRVCPPKKLSLASYRSLVWVRRQPKVGGSPKGPCTSMVYTWALTGFLYPYFLASVGSYRWRAGQKKGFASFLKACSCVSQHLEKKRESSPKSWRRYSYSLLFTPNSRARIHWSPATRPKGCGWVGWGSEDGLWTAGWVRWVRRREDGLWRMMCGRLGR